MSAEQSKVSLETRGKLKRKDPGEEEAVLAQLSWDLESHSRRAALGSSQNSQSIRFGDRLKMLLGRQMA